MKILFATHFFPYPPDLGGRIGFYNPLKYLSRRHDMVLFSLVDANDGPNIEAMRGMCSDIVTYVPAENGHWRRLLRGAVAEPPGTASKYFFPQAGSCFARRFGGIVPTSWNCST